MCCVFCAPSSTKHHAWRKVRKTFFASHVKFHPFKACTVELSISCSSWKEFRDTFGMNLLYFWSVYFCQLVMLFVPFVRQTVLFFPCLEYYNVIMTFGGEYYKLCHAVEGNVRNYSPEGAIQLLLPKTFRSRVITA